MKQKKEGVFRRIADRSLRENAQAFVHFLKRTNFKRFTLLVTVVLVCAALAGTLAVKFTQREKPQWQQLTQVVVHQRPNIPSDAATVQQEVENAQLVAVVRFDGDREFCYGGTRDRVVVEQVLRGDTSLIGQEIYFYENLFLDNMDDEWVFRVPTTGLFQLGAHYLIFADRLNPLDPVYWSASGREELPEFTPKDMEISGFNLANTESEVMPEHFVKRDFTKDTNEFNALTQEEVDLLYAIKKQVLTEFGLM